MAATGNLARTTRVSPKALLAELRGAAAGRGLAGARGLLARAQPYLVSVRQRELEAYARGGLATELVGGIWAWEGGYDAVRGLTADGRDPSDLVV